MVPSRVSSKRERVGGGSTNKGELGKRPEEGSEVKKKSFPSSDNGRSVADCAGWERKYQGSRRNGRIRSRV